MSPVYFRIKKNDSFSFSFFSSNSFEVLGYSSEELLQSNNLFWDLVLSDDKSKILNSITNKQPPFQEYFSYMKNPNAPISFTFEVNQGSSEQSEYMEGFIIANGSGSHTIPSLDSKSDFNEKNFKSILQHLPDLVLRLNSELKCVFVNFSSTSMVNTFSSDLLGKHLDEFILDLPLREIFKENLNFSLTSGEIRDLDFQISKSENKSFYRARIVPESADDKINVSCIIIISDITKSKLAAQTLQFTADHDFLTGLKNREYFLKYTQNVINNCSLNQLKCAVILFDVDKFQEINDALGHMIGDELLKTVADLLRKYMTTENALARYGGDEFAVVIRADKELGNFLDVFPLLMQISDLFSKPVTVVDNQIYTSISMGISIYPDDGGDPDTLLQNADRALYFSKQKEYNSFTFYKSEMDMQTTIKRNIVHSLRRAIENNEFTLVYQPKIDLRTGKVSGAEALIRWNNEGTWVSPMDFIPAAEESGLIIPIGKWVLEEAARDTKYIHEKGFENFRMSVNISAKQFHVPGIGKFIIDLLTLNDISPEMFEVEITEGVAMKNVNLSEIILRELDSKGVKISIDDFGTGHSSLAYLKKFPIDILKIDKTFIKDIPHDKESCAIVNAVLSMSHELDIEVVAEGVEVIEQLNFLQMGGCEYIQGYYFSKPVPLNLLETFLGKYNK
jgi:diguanylate cyclase (GGDEF)-like protein